MTYFSNWPNWAARLVLAAMAALVILGAALSPSPHPPQLGAPGATDEMLYRAVAERVMHGENYYTAAAAEQRARFYPTAPAQVFRLPTLAWTVAALQTGKIRRAVMIGLSLAAFIALRNGLARTAIDGRLRVLAIPMIGTGLAIAWIPDSAFMHEIWAGMLIAISLGLYRPDRWRLPVLLGLAACLFRELALPYLMAMAAFALYERRYRELAGWIAAMAVFSALFAWHLSIAGTLHRPGDFTSDSWIGFGGWPFVLEAAKRNFALVLAPNAIIAPVVCLAVIGLAGARDPWVSRAAVIVCGYLASFLVFGRPDNSYWGMLISPLIPIGVALSPLAFRDLIARAWAPHPIPPALQTLRDAWHDRMKRLSFMARRSAALRQAGALWSTAMEWLDRFGARSGISPGIQSERREAGRE